MTSSNTSFRPTHFTRLVEHLEDFDDGRRERMAELYSAPSSSAEGLADYWMSHPDDVVEVVKREVTSSAGWKMIEEAALDHDLSVVLDWTSARQRDEVVRLGLLNPTMDSRGRCEAVMPAALAILFADRVRGPRGSLPIILGRTSDEEVRRLATRWGVLDEGSTVQIILRLCDRYGRKEMVDEILESLPNPDWIGDALMILELGGVCHWQQLYGYDLESGSARDEKVVPLMRGEDRRQQRDMAETLMELGVMFRLEDNSAEHTLAAVPEELWDGLWKLGRRWLMDWTARAEHALRESAFRSPSEGTERGPGLQTILKWWLCEIGAATLVYEPKREELADETRRHLDRVFSVEAHFDWEDAWQLGQELRILDKEPYGIIGRGPEAFTLLDGPRAHFVSESLMEWCLGYSGGRADGMLARALGLDEAWRTRAVTLMRRYGEPVPKWMAETGVEPGTTGGGWLRQPGTGHDEMILFEVGLTISFVLTTKLMWLDVTSLLEGDRDYPVEGLVDLMQCVAALAMFNQLRFVLDEQPAPIYLPFQRSSFLMDQRQKSDVADWVEDVVDHLLVPLGVAQRVDGGQKIRLQAKALRVDDPPGWPEGQRAKWIDEIFHDERTLEVHSRGQRPRIREVTPVPEDGDDRVAVDTPLDALLKAVKGRGITGFDGRYLEFG